MSFTSEIRDFSKARLRTTTTNVTRMDGSKWVETRPSDQHGYVVSRSPGDTRGTEYGYVVDVAPDLQIGWILPNLLLGQWTSDYFTKVTDTAALCDTSRYSGYRLGGRVCSLVGCRHGGRSSTLANMVLQPVAN